MIDSSSAVNAFELISHVVNLGKKATQVQRSEALLAARELLVEQREENLKLTEEIFKLRKVLDRKKNFIKKMGVVWEKDDKNFDQPYCPVCFAKNLEVMLQMACDGRIKEQTLWKCPNSDCNSLYNPFNWEEPEAQSKGIYDNISNQWNRRY